ncbi:MAG: hypothetical protein KDB24_04580 [Microthrixaceae bacterium]|nr:hypothetical protein [Microthrixaceae bacterium]
MVSRLRYSPWDGTQVGFDVDALDIMEELTDDLLYSGDVNAALRRLLQEGMTDRDGKRLEGLADLIERLRQRREEMLANSDLGSAVEGIGEELAEITDLERAEMDRQERAARDSGDDEWIRSAEESFTNKRFDLDLMPPDLAGRMKALDNYDFTSDEARERFEALTEKLRGQLLDQAFNQMSGAMANLSPEDLARNRDMMAELNSMLEARAEGREPDFDGFMERFGDMFPENPQNLDELLEALARRMAATQALMNSLSPEQRAELGALSEQILSDLGLNFEMSRLADNLRQMFPDAGWSNRYDTSGFDPLDLAQASQLMSELGDLDSLQGLLRSAATPGALDEVDLDRLSDLMGHESAEQVRRLAELTRQLQEAGLIDTKEGRLELTPAGLRRLGQNALAQVFRHLRNDQLGTHEQAETGVGHEPAYVTRPWEWGDPFRVDLHTTVRNAVLREAAEGNPPTGRVSLSPDDFEIAETENQVRAATVLMLDLSLSMPMRDYFLPAKRVAMALHGLITMQYPRDYLGIVGFSEVARVLKPSQLPEASWDYVYGTNMAHGFQLARELLAHEQGTKQILMVTDGEPTAHIGPSGDPHFQYPPSQATIDATLTEVGRCTRANIRINTFMLEPDGGLARFIERLSQMNGGRAFFADPSNLGEFVLVDFVEQRRQRLARR